MDPRDDPFDDNEDDDDVDNDDEDDDDDDDRLMVDAGEEDELDEENEEVEEEGAVSAKPNTEDTPARKGRKQKGSLLTGRGVTMQMLIDDNILEAGEKLLSIDYLGKKFEGDLLPDGQIRWSETGIIFSSPSSWAMHCKKLVNPTKKSGCGWASVRYKGKKLDQFKSTWFRNQKQKSTDNMEGRPQSLSVRKAHGQSKSEAGREESSQNLSQKKSPMLSPGSMPHIMSPTSKHYSMKSPLYGPGGPHAIDTAPSHHAKPQAQKTHRTSAPGKRPPGRPPKNRPVAYEPQQPAHVHPDGLQYTMSQYSSPPHHPHAFGHRQSPTAIHHAVKSPPPSHHPQGHSTPSHFSPSIPGRTGNVMTFSEALEMVKHQSARKMEQSGPYDYSRAHDINPHSNPRVVPVQQPFYTVHGRVYKKKPGRPPKDPNKIAAQQSMMQVMPRAPTASPSSRGRGRRISRTRMSIKHAGVHPDSDPLTLVECAQFASIGKIQPFSLTFTTNSLLVIDFHCHLSTSEVTGYLGGKWDASRQHLRVVKAYPCKCRIADKDDGLLIESQIRDDMQRADLILVGWYHSHPFSQPDPTLQDIKHQLSYQKVLQDEDLHEPCIGLIVSPYDSHKKEAAFKAFWVQEHSQVHPEKLPLPLSMNFTMQQDQQLSQDVVNEMVSVVNFYKGNPDSINFKDVWTSNATYLDKVKHSAVRKFPLDQTDGRFLDFISKLLIAASS